MSPDRTPGGEAQYKHRNKKLGLLRDYKSALGCEDCGENDWVVLDLHHRKGIKNPKLIYKTDTAKRNGGGNWTRLSYGEIAEELEKCSVLCANCHRKETYRLQQER